MKSILLVAILLFVLAGVHSVSTRRNRVERQAPDEAGDGDNDKDDDDDDDDDDDEDPPEASDTGHTGQTDPKLLTRGNQNMWTNKRLNSKKVNNVAENKPGINTTPAIKSSRTHWSRNQNHHKTHRQTHQHTHRQADRQTHRQTHRHNHRQSHHHNRHQIHRQPNRQTQRQTNRHTDRQAQHQDHRQTHQHANRQHHQNSHSLTKLNQRNRYQTQQKSPSTSNIGKSSGTFAQRQEYQKPNLNVRQSNFDFGRKFRNANSLKVNAVSNSKQPQGILNSRTNHNRRNNVPENAAQGTQQSINRQRSFNWRNRGLKIRQPQQPSTSVTQKPTVAPSVTRGWDHVTRQVSPQPTYTTPSPPVHRQNPKSSVVHNRWNRNRFVNSNRKTDNSYKTSKEVKHSVTKTITNNQLSSKIANKEVKQTFQKSQRRQQPNTRFDNKQMRTNVKNRNYWHSQRQKQATSNRFVSQQQRGYPNNRATQYPVRKEYMAASVKQSKKPGNVMQPTTHSQAVLSSSDSNSAKKHAMQFASNVYPQQGRNVQQASTGTRYNSLKSGRNIRNGGFNTRVTWSGASTSDMKVSSSPSATAVSSQSGLSANNKHVRANPWNNPTLFSPGSQVAGQTKQPKLELQPNQQADPATQTDYQRNGNGQANERMLTDSSVNKKALADSQTTSSLTSGSSTPKEWSSQPRYKNAMPTINNNIGWASESGSTNPQGNRNFDIASASKNSISSNSWRTTLDNKQQQQHQYQIQHQQQLKQQHQERPVQSSPDRNRWIPNAAVSVQNTPKVEEAVTTGVFLSEPSGQTKFGTKPENRNQQQSAASSSSITLMPKSSSASAATHVPNEMLDTSVVVNKATTSITHDIPIPSFEAMGLARQPTESWTTTSDVAVSSKSSEKMSSQNINTNSQNTVPSTLARHFIRESVTEHHTKTKIEEKPTLTKAAVIENPTTNQGSTSDHIPVHKLDTKKTLLIGSQPSNQHQTDVSKTIDLPQKLIAQDVDKVSRIISKNSKDFRLYAPTLTITEGEATKPGKVNPVEANTASNSPASPESLKQLPGRIQGPKEVESTKGKGSFTGNNQYDTEHLRTKTGFDSSPNRIYKDRLSAISRHSIDTSSRTKSTAANTSGSKTPSTVTGPSQSSMSGNSHQINSATGITSVSHPTAINNNFRNFDRAAARTNKISSTTFSSPNKQGQRTATASRTSSVNYPNKNSVPSLSQPQMKSASGFVSTNLQNKVANSYNANNAESTKVTGSNTKDSTALLSQQSMVLHHNIDVIQSGTSSINQGAASLSSLSGDVNKGNTKTIQKSETRHSQNTVYESPAVVQKQQQGNRVVEPHQDIPDQLKQSILQPVSFIDSVNKEMAALSAHNTIPVVNQVRKDQVFVSRRNEWDTIVPSIPDILASMGRPKLSFGVDPGHTVQAIKRVPKKAAEKEKAPSDTKQNKSKQSSGPSALDVALGITGRQNENTLEAKQQQSGKSNTITKSDVSFIEYNTIERRQSQADPIKEVQTMYNQLGGNLPNVGEVPFNVGLPGDQVYTPTSSGSLYQPIKQSLPLQPKAKAQDLHLEGTAVSPSSSSIGPHSSQTGQIDTFSTTSVVKTEKGTHLVSDKPLQKDTAIVSSSALSSPVTGTTRSVGVIPSTTVPTTTVPSFSSRKLTTSHHVLLERMFDYNAIVTTTPTPVNRIGKVVYTQMQNGPFKEGHTVSKPQKNVLPTPVNRNSVVDYTNLSGRQSMQKHKINDSVQEKWRPSFTFNEHNELANQRAGPKTRESMNSFTTNSKTQSLVSFPSAPGGHFSSSHTEVRKVDMPEWNADYSVANSLSGFGEIDLKQQSTIDTNTSSSSAGSSGNNLNESPVKDTTKTGSSSIQTTTVKPIVSGKTGQPLTEEVVASVTGSANTSDSNIPVKSSGATNEAPVVNSLINPSGMNIFSGDSSSASLMSHNEYGIETTTQTNKGQTKSETVPLTPRNRKSDKFQRTGQHPNELFPGIMKFQRHKSMGFYSVEAGNKPNPNSVGEVNNNVDTQFKSTRPNKFVSRPPPSPMFPSRGMTSSYQTAGRISGKYNFMRG